MLLSKDEMEKIRIYYSIENGKEKERLANKVYPLFKLMVEYILNKHYNQIYKKYGDDLMVVMVEKAMLSRVNISKIKKDNDLFSYIYQLVRNGVVNYIRDNGKLNLEYVGTYWDLSKVIYGYNELDE